MKRQIKRSPARAYLVAMLSELLLLPLFALIFALVLSRMRDPSSLVGAAALGTLILTAFTSGLLTRKIRTEGWVATALAASLTLSAVLIAAALIYSGGSSLPRSLLSSVCYIAVFMLTAALASGRKKKRRRRR